MRKYITILSLIMLFAFTNESQAQKIGYVNTAALIQQIPAVKESTSNLDTYRNQLMKKGQEMLTSLQNKYKELERRQAAGEISPKQLEVEAQALKAEEAKIVEFEQQSQQKIVEKNETLMKPLREKIQKAIDDVAAENGYSYIFDYSTGMVLYADASVDVSDLVKAKLGL